MFDGNFFEVSCPVDIEAVLISSLLVILLHDGLGACKEAVTELKIMLVAGPHRRLVVRSVFERHLCIEFVFWDGSLWSGGTGFWPLIQSRVGSRVKSREINLEDGSAKASELPRLAPAQIFISLHRHQVLDVFVLFLADLVAWQLDEMFLVQDAIKEQDHCSEVIQERHVKLLATILLDVH